MRKVEGSEIRKWNDVGEMPIDLWNALSSFHRDYESQFRYEVGRFPAAATLRDGKYYPAVNFVERKTPYQSSHFSTSGFVRTKYKFDWRTMIDIHDVASVSASPNWTPDMIWQKMMRGTNYDFFFYKLKLKDGTEYWHGSTQTDFIRVPNGYEAKDIVDAIYPSDQDRHKPGFRFGPDMDDPYEDVGTIYPSIEEKEQKENIDTIRIMSCFFDRPYSIRKKPRSF